MGSTTAIVTGGLVCNQIIIMLPAYIALFHVFMLKVLHIITLPSKAVQLLKVKPGIHITPGWREAQSRLASCPRMLSQMKQWAVLWFEPGRLSSNSNTLTTEPPMYQAISAIFHSPQRRSGRARFDINADRLFTKWPFNAELRGFNKWANYILHNKMWGSEGKCSKVWFIWQTMLTYLSIWQSNT